MTLISWLRRRIGHQEYGEIPAISLVEMKRRAWSGMPVGYKVTQPGPIRKQWRPVIRKRRSA